MMLQYITWSAIDKNCKFYTVSQRGTMLPRAYIPGKSDEHIMKSRGNAHRQSSIDNVVCYQMRAECISTVIYLQLSSNFRFLVHFQHVQCNTLSKFSLKPLQANVSLSEITGINILVVLFYCCHLLKTTILFSKNTIFL